MKCPVCKTECGEQSVCSECGFGQLMPEFLNHADTEYWIQNVVWPHRERYWEQIKSIFHIENRKLLRVDLEQWMKQNPLDTEVILSVPYGVEEIVRNCFCRFVPIEGPYVDIPPVKTVYIPKTVSAIDPLAFESVAQIALDPSNPYYYVCKAHLIDKRTSALVIGPHPISLSKLPTDIKCLSSHSCTFVSSGESYLHLPNTISKIDSSALVISNPSCCVHIPKSVSFIDYGGICVRCFGNKGCSNKNIHIFCDYDSCPDTWNKDWIIQCEISGFDSDISTYVCWQGMWHYENGRPVPNTGACGELVPREYLF